jgi:hypothetical protein
VMRDEEAARRLGGDVHGRGRYLARR